jgi:hypothetical protein
VSREGKAIGGRELVPARSRFAGASQRGDELDASALVDPVGRRYLSEGSMAKLTQTGG